MHLSAADERGLTLCESDSLAVPARDPAAAGNRKRDLAEPCLVWANDAARLEVDDVRVGVAFPLASSIEEAKFTS